MLGTEGLQMATGEYYYAGAAVLLKPLGQQPLCVQVSVAG